MEFQGLPAGYELPPEVVDDYLTEDQLFEALEEELSRRVAVFQIYAEDAAVDLEVSDAEAQEIISKRACANLRSGLTSRLLVEKGQVRVQEVSS